MFSQVTRDPPYTILSPLRGQYPVQALVLGPRGRWASVDLLPRLSIVEQEDLSEEQAEQVLRLVGKHRDTLLTAWSAPAPHEPATQAGPRATGVSFDPRRRVLTLRLATGAALRCPASMVPGLSQAEPLDAMSVKVTCGGAVLAWERLDLYVRLQDLALVATGGPAWQDRLMRSTLPEWQVLHVPNNGKAAAEGAAAPTEEDQPKIRSLIGLILYREGLLTIEAVQVIAQRQQAIRAEGGDRSFGQVGLELGLLTPEHLRFALHLQDRLAHAPAGGKPLGIHLLENATLTPSQLISALGEQDDTGERLGEILVRRGIISAHTLSTFIERQRQAQPAAKGPPPEASEARGVAAPADEADEGETPGGSRGESGAVEPPPATGEVIRFRSLLGLILEREGYITQAQVRHIIAEQDRERAAGKHVTFGEMALRQKLLTAEQLRFAINLQKRLAYDPGRNKPLWATMLENGVLKPSQIHLLLGEHERTGRPVEQLMVDQGLVSEGMLRVFQEMHSSR
ncbi:MAG: hypothetical protein VKP62_04465 [Candidatus Sericytochromatia bacterium]|nr:hypothetical protein [Candidatus Sericytochromatia bacterium]